MRTGGIYLLKHGFWVLVGMILSGLILFGATEYSTTWDLTRRQEWSLSEKHQQFLRDLPASYHLIFMKSAVSGTSPVRNDHNRTVIQQFLRDMSSASDRIRSSVISLDQHHEKAKRFTEKFGVSLSYFKEKEPVLVVRDEAVSESVTNDSEGGYTNSASESNNQREILPLRSFAKGGISTPEGTVVLEPETVEHHLFQSFIRLHRTNKYVGIFLRDEESLHTKSNAPSLKFTHLQRILERELGFELYRSSVSSLSTHQSGKETVLVITGTAGPFSKSDRKKIRRYLEQGGRMLLLTDPGRGERLEPLLRQYGIQLGSSVSMEQSDRHIRRFPGTVKLDQWSETHAVSASLATSGHFLVARDVLPIRPRQNMNETAPVQSLLHLQRAESDSEEEAHSEDPGDHHDRVQVPIAVASQMHDTRVVVMGDSDAFSDQFMFRSGTGSYWFFLNAVRWCAGLEDELDVVRPDRSRSKLIVVTRQEASRVFQLLVLTVPGMLLVVGLSIWWFRRLYYR